MRAKNHLDASWYANAPIIIAEGGGFKLTAREPDHRPVPSRAFNWCGLMNPQSGAKLRRNWKSAGFQERRIPLPPPRKTWSIEMGPAPKKIKAKARAASARGNSKPGRSGAPIRPFRQ